MYKNHLTSYLLIIFLGMTQIAFAQEGSLPAPPSAEDLKGRLMFELPRLWEVNSVKIEASHNFGSNTAPVYKQRFDASLTLKEDLYKLIGNIEGKQLVENVAKEGDSETLYGTATATYTMGRYDVEFEFESPPKAEGRTLEEFEGEVLVKGSPEERQLTAEQQRKVDAERLAREEEAAIQRKKAEAAARQKAEAEAQKRAAEEEKARKIAEQRAAFQRKVTELNAIEDPGRLARTSKGHDAIVPLAIGDKYYIVLTGDDKSGWVCRSSTVGQPVYPINSSLARVAVHSGALKNGERGIIEVEVIPAEQIQMSGSTRNGVTCLKAAYREKKGIVIRKKVNYKGELVGTVETDPSSYGQTQNVAAGATPSESLEQAANELAGAVEVYSRLFLNH